MVAAVPVILRSGITCPHCDLKAVEDMPTDACVCFYECLDRREGKP